MLSWWGHAAAQGRVGTDLRAVRSDPSRCIRGESDGTNGAEYAGVRGRHHRGR